MSVIRQLACGLVAIAFAAAVSVPAEAQAQETLFVLPLKGQSAQQQQKDSFECHQLAVAASGFDPNTVSADPSAGRGAFKGLVAGLVAGGIVAATGGTAAAIALTVGGGSLLGGIIGADRRQNSRGVQRPLLQRGEGLHGLSRLRSFTLREGSAVRFPIAIVCGAVAVLGLCPAPAVAADSYICGISEVFECLALKGCNEVSPQTINMSPLIALDIDKKQLSSAAMGGAARSEDIEGVSTTDKAIFLYGSQDQNSWNATISLETGALTGGVTSGTSSFAMFGSCTKK